VKALKVNDKFRFAESIGAIHLTNPFDGFSMGYHAPSSEAKELYRPELLGEEIDIPNTDTLVVIEAYASISGWCIRAKWHDHTVHFHQAGVTGLRSVNPSVATLLVVETTER